MVVGKEVATVQVELSATINSPTVIGVIVIGVIADGALGRFSQTRKAFQSNSQSVYVIFVEHLRQTVRAFQSNGILQTPPLPLPLKGGEWLLLESKPHGIPLP